MPASENMDDDSEKPAEFWHNPISEMGRSLGTLRFASDPLGDPHPELSLVAYGLRSRDVFRRGDLFGGQAQWNRRLCTGVPVADLPGQRGRRLGLRGLGQLIPHARSEEHTSELQSLRHLV